MRALLWLLIGLAVYLLIRKWQREREMASTETRRVDVPLRPGATTSTPGRMVRCAHCGLHLPESEAVRGADARDYCSPSHLAAGPGAGLPG
ncbi:PP0621 family protein [Leptothrix sp. BB-4]